MTAENRDLHVRKSAPGNRPATRPGDRPKTKGSSEADPPINQAGQVRVWVWRHAYGRFIYRMRWGVLATWVVVVLVGVPFALRSPSVLEGGGYFNINSQATRVDSILHQRFGQPRSEVVAVFQSTHVPVSDSAYQREVRDFMARVRGFRDVAVVRAGGVGRDGRTTFVTVGFTRGPDDMQRAMADFRRLLPSPRAEPAKAYLSGSPAIYQQFTIVTEQDVERSDGMALPLVLAALLAITATLVAALLPLALGIAAVVVSLGLIFSIAHLTPTSVFILSIASIIGLGISLDYSLLLTRRFREELAKGQATSDAVAHTVATAGEAILFSGLAVMIGFLGLFLIRVPVMSSFAIGGSVVVAVAVLAALTLLPALLSILGTRVNALRIPLMGRRRAVALPADGQAAGSSQTQRQGFWHRWAMAVMRHPIITSAAVVVVVALLAYPTLSLKVGVPDAAALPTEADARQGQTVLQTQFPDLVLYPIYVVAQTRDGASVLTAPNLERVARLTQWARQQQSVSSVEGLLRPPTTGTGGTPVPSTRHLVRLYSTGAYRQVPALAQLASATASGNTTVLKLGTTAPLDSPAGKALIDHLRARSGQDGLQVLVGGFQATSLDLDRILYRNFPYAILFIAGTTFVLLLISFRSLLLPLKAILMDALSVAATFGVLVHLFQWGHLGLFKPEPFIDAINPILLFCVLFGLSMDYEVFLLSRMREEWLHT